ncbi:DNA topoisomerase [Baffinella frigidus]|nr:DNA topoisomerase [Cryptophyta sp. CCMP2293]
MIMTDQDPDGSHIKGLFFNMMHHYWPDLLKSNNFILEFVTPIVKAFPKAGLAKASEVPVAAKGKKAKTAGGVEKAGKKREKVFFTLQEYHTWWAGLGDAERKTWRIKYYKGLGLASSTPTTAQ